MTRRALLSVRLMRFKEDHHVLRKLRDKVRAILGQDDLSLLRFAAQCAAAWL